MPPLALISSTASSADCTTDGATTLLAPLRPTGTPILIGSAAMALPLNARTLRSASDPKYVSLVFMIPLLCELHVRQVHGSALTRRGTRSSGGRGNCAR